MRRSLIPEVWRRGSRAPVMRPMWSSHMALTVAADSPAMAGARLPSVLVVEDDAPVRRMLERTLAAEGYAVDAVADGGSALAHAEAAAPDAIVLDVAMPGMDGLAVARRLRSKGVATPILMLTARDGVHDRVAGLDAGADDYLVKPFAVVELAARMRALLRRTRPVDVRTYADLSSTRAPAPSSAAAGRSSSPRARPTCSNCCCAGPAMWSPAGRLWRESGATAAPRARTSSTATSPTCARSSATHR